MITIQMSIILPIVFLPHLHGQTFSSERTNVQNSSPSSHLDFRRDFPRLCAYHHDPSQYYPCVLNYIGLNSWTLYRCPDRTIFDEVSQECLMKIPINDAFEQLASLSSNEDAPFHHIASFILATPSTNENEGDSQERIVSLSPMVDRFVEPFSSEKLLRRVG